MNAGPGAVAGLYLNRRYFDSLRGLHAGLSGRPGRNDDEGGDLAQDNQRQGLAAALQLGPTPVLSLAPLDGAIRVLEEAGLARVRAKSLELTHFLRAAIESEMPALDFVTPREPDRRGAHLALRHSAARDICSAMREQGVSADFREPDLIGLSPSPLYNSFTECWDAVQILRRVVDLQADAALANAGELVS